MATIDATVRGPADGRRSRPSWRTAFGAGALLGGASLLGHRADGAGGASPGYPPLDTPKPFADDVWLVDSLMPGLLGRILPVRMTAIRLPDGALLLHSPTRWSGALAAALGSLGPIRHLVLPNTVHWIFAADWQRNCPDATVWAAPGLASRKAVQRADLRIDRVVDDGAAAAWGDAFDIVVVPGGFGFREVALAHRPSRTLVLTDLVMSLDPGQLPLPFRPLVAAAGCATPDGMPPPHVRALFRAGGEAARAAAHRLVASAPDRVVFAHGTPFAADGTERLRHALRWLLA